MAILPNEAIAEFLGTQLINNSFMYLDLWSVVHLISGVLLFFGLKLFLRKVNVTFWAVFVLLLIAYEVFEVLFYNSFFAWESNINILWDIIIGVLGGVIAWRFTNGTY